MSGSEASVRVWPAALRARCASALAGAVLLLVCCGRQAEDTAGGQRASDRSRVPVTVARLRLASMPVTVSAYGSVSGGANGQASLAFAEPGRIAHVDVTVGQQVRAGDVLAQLDSAPFAAEVAQAQANVAVAQANYSKAAAGARPQERAQTAAQLEQAKTQLAAAQAQLDRQHRLLQLGVASQSDVDSANAAAAAARAQVRVLEEQQSVQTHPLVQDVEAARAQRDQAEAELNAARLHLAYSALTAPFSGVVTARLHNDGESVDQSTPVVELAGNGPATFTADFAPEDAQRIRVGDAATVEAKDMQLQLGGHVSAISPAQTGEGHLTPVVIALDQRDPRFGPGSYGQASISVASARGLVVASSAIVADPNTGTALIFRKNGDRYDAVPIQVKGTFGRDAWIESRQLRPGDEVVVEGAYELQNAPAAKQEQD